MIRRQVFHTIGFLIALLGLSMIFSIAWSIYYASNDLNALLKSSVISITFGLILFYFCKDERKDNPISTREGFAIVTLGWLFMVVFASLPFYLSGELKYTDAFFEAMSGLTTTGASILNHNTTFPISEMPKGLLFWRSFTQFIGGMGIIVFSIAILPMLGMGGAQLFRAEVAGPTVDKFTPRVKQTAKLLWGIYVGFVLILSLILKIEGMTWFDAFCHSFCTIATSGFSTQNNSIESYSIIIQWTIIIFMFLAASNFSLHYYFLSKGKFEYLKDKEFQYYIILILIFSSLFFINIFNIEGYKYFGEAIRHSTFTAVSLLTTTGYANNNYETWPAMSQMLIFVLLFIGGSAGSTTGGLKIIRTIVISKYLLCEIRRLLHPKGIFNITIGNKTIEDNVLNSTIAFYLFYIFIFIITAIVLSMTGLDFMTSLTASASSIGNIGPGLGDIGPSDSWGHLSDFAKWLTSFCMLLGRLEIFTVLVLFSRSFWRV